MPVLFQSLFKENCGKRGLYTEDPRYNDTLCYQRFCCYMYIKFAVVKKLDMDPSKA